MRRWPREAVRLPTAPAAFLKGRGLSYTGRAASGLDAAGIAMTLATQLVRTHQGYACTRGYAAERGVSR